MLREAVSKTVAHLAQPSDQDASSYRRLRTVIGILGIALPFAIWLVAVLVFGQKRQPSISAFYYTGARDLFVGMLCAIGVFLAFYKGPQLIDQAVSTWAGVFAVCVALFPTEPEQSATELQALIGKFHMGFAGAFFALITLMVLFLFTKGDKTDPAKRVRNAVFVVCGITMTVCIGLMLVQAWLFPASKARWTAHGITFVLETISIEAFGIAWLTKGAGG